MFFYIKQISLYWNYLKIQCPKYWIKLCISPNYPFFFKKKIGRNLIDPASVII